MIRVLENWNGRVELKGVNEVRVGQVKRRQREMAISGAFSSDLLHAYES